MIERIKSHMPFERPLLDFEGRFGESRIDQSFEQRFFDFDDRLYYWTTIYRYILFLDYDLGTQLMIGIGQKNISNYSVNGVPMEFASDPPEYKVGLSYWYQSDELLHITKNEILRNYEDGFACETLSFRKDIGGYNLKLDEIRTEIHIKEKWDEDFLQFKSLWTPFYRHNAYFPFEGKILDIESRGVAFIQKVSLNMPFIPWRWGRAFFEGGAQLDFYEPRALVPIFRSLNFQIGDEVYEFKKGTETVMEGARGYPRWRVSGRTRGGEEIEARIASHAHICQTFETPRTRFSYNEFPSKVVGLKIKKGRETLYTLDDLGRNAANCEDAHYSKILGNI
ncbi:MAG: hypothetical protein ACE5PM_08625 [Candidatus Hydrothermarchaeales archaeon]